MELDELLQLFDELQATEGKISSPNVHMLDTNAFEIEEKVCTTAPSLETGMIGVSDDRGYEDGKRQIKDMLYGMSNASSVWQVFTDWIAIMALVISNMHDGCQLEERMETLKSIDMRYNNTQGRSFLKMFSILSGLIEVALHRHDYHDFLGEIYEELDLESKEHAQVFTPSTVSSFMGDIAAVETEMQEKGYITMIDPAAGSGRMILEYMKSLEQYMYKPRTDCAVLAVDTDIRCVHMCYIQLSLYGIPAVVQHGDSLSMVYWSRWYTPVYILDMWVWRERLTLTDTWNLENERLKCFTQPMYGFLRYGPSLRKNEKA